MAHLDPRRDRPLLLAALLALFLLSALTDPSWLAAAWLLALLGFRRGAPRVFGRLLRSVVPISAGFSAASAGWLAWVAERPVDWRALAALNLRTTLLAFLTLSVLARVNLVRALAPWPAVSRLLAIVLGQVHALRLLVTDLALGLQSRMPRRPGALDVVRGAGAVTATLVTLSARNARDVADALRARGA